MEKEQEARERNSLFFFFRAVRAMTAPTVVCSGRQLNDLNVVRGSPNKNTQNKNPQNTNNNNTKTLKKSEINAGETVKRTN